MTAGGRRYLEWLKTRPCARCQSPGVEIAHVKGAVSAKTGLELPRRHNEAILYAVPLCAYCHRTGKASIHNVGEPQFFASMRVNPHQLVATLFCRYFESGGR